MVAMGECHGSQVVNKYRVTSVSVSLMLAYPIFFSKGPDKHWGLGTDARTDFPSGVGPAQTLGLFLDRPALEELLEERRLRPVVDGLHIGVGGVVLHLDELLQGTRIRMEVLPAKKAQSVRRWRSEESCVPHQSSGHGRLLLCFVRLLPFPDKDLGPSLVNDVAVLNNR